MKQLLIITGPQGSGNHLWSKIFAHTKEVAGWKTLKTQYWHSHEFEPMHKIWEDPTKFATKEFPYDKYVTSISCPYTHGTPNLSTGDGGLTPDYDNFIKHAKLNGFEVKIAIIGRDENILEFQQCRLRGQYTLPWFQDKALSVLVKYNPAFISTELLYLYREHYLKQVSDMLDFPILVEKEALDEILKENANRKYLKPIETHWLDDHMNEMFNQKHRKS
jgi:hypothetical protein